MSVSATTLARTVLGRLESGQKSSDLASSLAAYLIEERQVDMLPTLLREMQRLQLQNRNICYVHATSAFPLEAAQLKQIEKKFQARTGATTVIIEQTIDKDVIGGVRCETADQLLDLTVRRQLQRLTRS